MHSTPSRLIEDMLKIYSPSGSEEELAAYIVSSLKEYGIDSERDDVGNVIAEVGSGEPRILLCGHMDTVVGVIPVRKEGDQLYGRGAVDAKGPLASMLYSFQRLSKERNPPNIVLACVVDEEREGKGITEFLKRNKEVDYAVFGEPSGVDNLILGYKGMLKVILHCTTRTGHSASPWLYKNAIEESFNIWKKLKEVKYGGETTPFRSLSSCLIKVEGGGNYGKVPDKCSFTIDFRLPPGLHPRRMLRIIEANIREETRGRNSLNIKIEGRGGVEAYEAEEDSILIKAFSIAIRRVRGKQPTYLKKTGTSDVNLMARAYSIPIIAYGPGDSKLDHSENEHLNLREFLDSLRVYEEAVRRIKILHGRT